MASNTSIEWCDATWNPIRARVKADAEQIAAGQTVGKLTVSLAGKVVLERPVVALQAVEEGGFFSRLWDSIKLWLGW